MTNFNPVDVFTWLLWTQEFKSSPDSTDGAAFCMMERMKEREFCISEKCELSLNTSRVCWSGVPVSATQKTKLKLPLWDRKLAQSMKCLPCECEDLGREAGHSSASCKPSTGEEKWGWLGQWVPGSVEKTPNVNHLPPHAHVCTCTWTQTHCYFKKLF